jgi:hypothetical protein
MAVQCRSLCLLEWVWGLLFAVGKCDWKEARTWAFLQTWWVRMLKSQLKGHTTGKAIRGGLPRLYEADRKVSICKLLLNWQKKARRQNRNSSICSVRAVVRSLDSKEAPKSLKGRISPDREVLATYIFMGTVKGRYDKLPRRIAERSPGSKVRSRRRARSPSEGDHEWKKSIENVHIGTRSAL